jgi:hypothetical protein
MAPAQPPVRLDLRRGGLSGVPVWPHRRFCLLLMRTILPQHAGGILPELG